MRKPEAKKPAVMTEQEIIKALTELMERNRQIEDEKRRNANASLVGTTWAGRNSYSCPQKESDYWMHYSMIVGLTDDGHLQRVSFDVDSNGDASFKSNGWMNTPFGDRIPYSQYIAAFRKAIIRATAIGKGQVEFK